MKAPLRKQILRVLVVISAATIVTGPIVATAQPAMPGTGSSGSASGSAGGGGGGAEGGAQGGVQGGAGAQGGAQGGAGADAPKAGK